MKAEVSSPMDDLTMRFEALKQRNSLPKPPKHL